MERVLTTDLRHDTKPNDFRILSVFPATSTFVLVRRYARGTCRGVDRNCYVCWFSRSLP